MSDDAATVSGTPAGPERPAGPGRPGARPVSDAFKAFIASGWADAGATQPGGMLASSPWAAQRRHTVSGLFGGDCLVVPAGSLVVRSNDTDYRFRPHSAFAHLTGLGTDQEPDAVLVLHPAATPGAGHEAALFFRPRAPRDSREFYADARYGELWVGARPSLVDMQRRTGLPCRHIDELEPMLRRQDPARLRVVRDASAAVATLVDGVRGDVAAAAEASATSPAAGEDPHPQDSCLARALSELRLVKDSWEVDQLRAAVAATVTGFEEVVRALPQAIGHPRGERVVERAFEGVSRVAGNGVGYESIAAAGPHACTLHWIRNDGPVAAGDLLLLDAGVEVDSLYTADVTRTLPVSGRFSPAQRRVYEVVLEAADAAFELARPGVRFLDLHDAAMRVIARWLERWGLLPGTAEQSLSDDGQFHRRWMVHRTSHHLGLDVHDCARARAEAYHEAPLRAGMVLTIEPGLYFRDDDLLVPAELRGIGVRIEDDVLITEDGCRNLTAALPRRPDEVETWLADLRSRAAAPDG